jgi:hypothetical protein
MNLLATPFAGFRRKRQQVDLTMDSYGDASTETSSSKLTSGYAPADSETVPSKCSKIKRAAGYSFVLLAILSALLSSLYLPFILLAPTKFCMLFSFALASAVTSLFLLKGSSYIKEKFLTGSIRYYTVALLISNCIGLVAAFRDTGAIICLVMSVVQFMALTYVLLFRVPYGKQFLDSIYGGCGRCLRGAASKVVERTN